MTPETTHTLIIGGGQAGLAMSAHLREASVPHLVLERDRIAERWRSGRWDSLVANGPAWHDRFPTREFSDVDGDAFAPKENVAQYFEDFAKQIDAPVRCGVEVLDVRRNAGRRGFRVETSDGVIEAETIVAATGPFQRPIIPPLVPETTGLHQLHSNAYRNPEQLPGGGVLVIGAGSSGTQIADELLRAGRDVTLAVGPHERPPRAYRGHDFCWWLGVLGHWEIVTPKPNTAHITIAVSGAQGGKTIDFRRLAAQGMRLTGMADRFEDGVMHFAPDLARNIRHGDASYLAMLDNADAYVVRNGLDLPEEPEARIIGPDPACMTDPVRALDLAREGITSILWATGYGFDYGWLNVDALDETGRPNHQRGISSEPGVYFLGLPWQSRRGSSFIWGVWQDAKFLADQIVIQRAYLDHAATA